MIVDFKPIIYFFDNPFAINVRNVEPIHLIGVVFDGS